MKDSIAREYGQSLIQPEKQPYLGTKEANATAEKASSGSRRGPETCDPGSSSVVDPEKFG